MVTAYGTLVPTLPPSVCVAGAIVTAYGGAIGVMNGEPVVKGPCAEVTFTPSLVIDVTLFLIALAMLTVKCTERLPPAATVWFDQVTVPPEAVPPLSADTNVGLAGTGSVIVTVVASAFPMFLTVRVYVTLLEGPTGLPASTFERTSAGIVRDSWMLKAPRPWVPAAKRRCEASRSSCQMETIGNAVPSALHVRPPLKVANGPTSVPTYKVFANEGSRITEFTGLSGRLPLMLVQLCPPSVVLKT